MSALCQAGVPVGSLLGAPDPSKTQVVRDTETGESKAKMTEEQALLAREIRRRGKNKLADEERRRRDKERISHLRQLIERERVDGNTQKKMAWLEQQLEQEIQFQFQLE